MKTLIVVNLCTTKAAVKMKTEKNQALFFTAA